MNNTFLQKNACRKFFPDIVHKSLTTSHLSRRGYNSEIINDAFNKLSDINKQKDLYDIKPDSKNKGKGVTNIAPCE